MAGDRTLAVQFPDMFKCTMDKDAKVKSYMSRIDDNVGWTVEPHFKEVIKGSRGSLIHLPPKSSKLCLHP